MPTASAQEIQVRFVKPAVSISAESFASIMSTAPNTDQWSIMAGQTENGASEDKRSSPVMDPINSSVPPSSGYMMGDALGCENTDVRHFEGVSHDERSAKANGDIDAGSGDFEGADADHAVADDSSTTIIHYGRRQKSSGSSGSSTSLTTSQGLNRTEFTTTFEADEEREEMEQEGRRTSVESTSSVSGGASIDSSQLLAPAANSSFRLVRLKEELMVELPASDFSTLEDSRLFPPTLQGSSILQCAGDVLDRYKRIPFLRFRLLFIAFLIGGFFTLPLFLSGLLSGLYLSLIIFLYVCVSDPIDEETKRSAQRTQAMELLREVHDETKREESGRTVYKGWMNMLSDHYSPHTFHVNKIQTVMVRLDGNLLRISRPERARTKHAFHTDRTLTEKEPRMVSQAIYDLAGAQVRLRPHRLARRRWFSRKYPIEIRIEPSSTAIELLPQHPKRKRVTSRAASDGTVETESAPASYSSTPSMVVEGSEESNLGSPLLGYHTLAGVNELDEMGHTADGYMPDTDDSAESEQLSTNNNARSHSVSDLADGSSTRPNSWKVPKRRMRSIYLFARSAREKERWFHQLRKACGRYQLGISEHRKGASTSACLRRATLSLPNLSMNDLTNDYVLYLLDELQFSKHLESIIAESASRSENRPSDGVVHMDLGRNKWQRSNDEAGKEFVMAVNLVTSRIFYDFCRDSYWIRAVQAKIQSKLSTIHLPYFIETLELSHFDIGTSIPRILKVYSAVVDDWGIWVDFEINYEGLIKLTLETKVNLLKLKEQNDSSTTPDSTAAPNHHFPTSTLRCTPNRYSDDDIPESPETSPDEEFGAKVKHTEGCAVRKKAGQKLLTLVDKIAHTKLFADVSELKPIRKLMEEVSSTRLILNVEISKLEGTMTINFAAPPSDRLWYGFRTPPTMSIKAVPQVGDRTVVLSTVSDWIESKVALLLEKVLVLPNMDDVVVPVLAGNQLLQGATNK